MNIFEFMGAATRTHAVQLVKHWEEVPEKKKAQHFMAQKKEDGVFAAVCLLGTECQIFGRTGLKLQNVEHLEGVVENQVLADELAEWMHYSRDGAYIAELIADDCSLEQLSGIVNPNRKEALTAEQEAIKSTMRLRYHDFVTVGQFIRGQANVPYHERYAYLKAAFCREAVIPSWTTAAENVPDFAAEQIAKGFEGAVFKDPDAYWVAGHKGCHSMKIVRDISYDLRCTGWEEGKGKYAGKVANLLFKLADGREFKAMLGKGYTHEDAQAMFLALNGFGFTSKSNPLGKIFAVYGLQASSKNGLIRLPKVGELRHDKTEPDFPSA